MGIKNILRSAIESREVRKSCLLVLIITMMVGCHQRAGKNERTVNTRGKRLSTSYCQSCHLYADPEVLDRTSWVRVLDLMEREMAKASVQIENKDWIDIQQYYLENSPLILPQPSSKKKIKASRLFQMANILEQAPAAKPFVTLIKYDKKRDHLYIGDISGNLSEFSQLEFRKTTRIGDTPVSLVLNGDDVDVLGIGSLMPYDKKAGQLSKVSDRDKRVVINGLRRPVHVTREDFNGDGKKEYLISCFGTTTGDVNSGRLTLFSSDQDTLKETLIKRLPGATKSITGDFNHDNRPDIIALFSQGREQLSLFINLGNFTFEERTLLEFLPVYGCNNFQLADINGDSYPDIILTNGDNGDSSPVFKYYHGVRIFMNDGNFQFKEEYFYPVHGASQVLVRDFDVDGDPDLVVLAMYPDLFNWSEESLVYFENKGDLNFEPAYLEKEPSGKWFLMDAGDVDRDGDDDLIVGTNFKVNPVLLPPGYKEKWDSSRISYTVFRNNRF